MYVLEDSLSRICGKKDEECSDKAKCKFWVSLLK